MNVRYLIFYYTRYSNRCTLCMHGIRLVIAGAVFLYNLYIHTPCSTHLLEVHLHYPTPCFVQHIERAVQYCSNRYCRYTNEFVASYALSLFPPLLQTYACNVGFANRNKKRVVMTFLYLLLYFSLMCRSLPNYDEKNSQREERIVSFRRVIVVLFVWYFDRKRTSVSALAGQG